MIGSVGAFDPAAFAAKTGLKQKQAADQDNGFSDLLGTPGGSSSTKSPSTTATSAKDTFMNYMKKSPAERMVENWLKAHKLDEKKLAAMSPEERQQIMDQMKQDIERASKEKAAEGSNVDISA